MKIILCYFTVYIISLNAQLDLSECNGIPGACKLRLNQITLPGAHNAGAGFDGVLYYHNPYVAAVSCWYRNQGENIYSLLNDGVRYLDIDLCHEERDGYEKGAWACHSSAYGGPMKKFLGQVDKWLNEDDNRNEIVVLHFNRDHDKGEEVEKKIGKSIIKLLDGLWEPSSENINEGKVVMQSNLNSKLEDSVKENKRIYVFLHHRLQTSKKNYFFHENNIGYTWKSMSFISSNRCQKLADGIAENCPHEARRPFVRLDLYLTSGLCVSDMAGYCNSKIEDSAKRCYRNIETSSLYKRGETVNFIVIDYADSKLGKTQVEVAKKITMSHIENLGLK